MTCPGRVGAGDPVDSHCHTGTVPPMTTPANPLPNWLTSMAATGPPAPHYSLLVEAASHSPAFSLVASWWDGNPDLNVAWQPVATEQPWQDFQQLLERAEFDVGVDFFLPVQEPVRLDGYDWELLFLSYPGKGTHTTGPLLQIIVQPRS